MTTITSNSTTSTLPISTGEVETIHLKTVVKTTQFRWNGKKWVKTERETKTTVDEVLVPPDPKPTFIMVPSSPPPLPNVFPQSVPWTWTPPYSPNPTWTVDLTSQQIPGMTTVVD